MLFGWTMSPLMPQQILMSCAFIFMLNIFFKIKLVEDFTCPEIFRTKVYSPFNVLAAHLDAVAIIKRLLEIGAETFFSIIYIRLGVFRDNLHNGTLIAKYMPEQ
jgi:hypothetical protein